MLEACKKKLLLPDNKIFELGSQNKYIVSLSVSGHAKGKSKPPMKCWAHFPWRDPDLEMSWALSLF